MKKLYIFVIALLISSTMLAQAPSSFKYQAVLRDARGNIRANTATNIIIDILQGSATGTAVYSETHNITTDGYGLINLELGNGTATNGTMSSINWGAGIYYVKVTVDGVTMGTSQLLSVPYALYAAKAGDGFSGSYTDLTNKPVLFDGTWTNLTGKPTTISGYGITDAFNGTWTSITGKPSLATVSTSGSYVDLINKPTLSLVTNTGSYNDLINLPTLTNGTVTNVTGTSPIIVATGSTTPVISMVQSSGTTDGYLSSTDWTKFNNTSSFDGTYGSLIGKPTLATVANSGSYADLINKPSLTNGTVTNVTGTSPITVTTGTTTPVIGMVQASGTTNGYLSSTDWTTFNGKSTFNGAWSSLTGKPTTVSGLGITDAVTTAGNQTIAGDKTFSGTTIVMTPVNATDATTKAYVDALKQQIKILEDNLIAAGTYKLADIEGTQYDVVKIGIQVWMKENLKTTKYNDGTPIPNITDNTAWPNLATGAYSDYDNTPSYSTTYGRLYNWFAVDNNAATKVASNGGKNVCPTGWHIPSYAEWTTLTDYLTNNGYGYGSSGNDIGKSMANTSGWTTDPTAGNVGNDQASNNSSGFTALPGGGRDIYGTYYSGGNFGFWWSSSEISTTFAYYWLIYYNYSLVDLATYSKRDGFSVRCLRD